MIIRPKTIKLLEENIGQMLHHTEFGHDLLDIKGIGYKGKINTQNFMKILKFCASKDSINRVKWQPTTWDKIFVYHLLDKELISRTHREFLKLKNNSKNKNLD